MADRDEPSLTGLHYNRHPGYGKTLPRFCRKAVDFARLSSPAAVTPLAIDSPRFALPADLFHTFYGPEKQDDLICSVEP